MSKYTAEHCRRRAEAVRALAAATDTERLIREHVEASIVLAGDEARIAAGFAAIARRRLAEDTWRADAYERLARGEDITK